MATPLGTRGEDPPPAAPMPRERLRVSSYSILRAVLITFGVLVLLRLLSLADTTLWWLAIATVLAGLYEPAALWLRRFLPGWAAIAIVVLGVVVIIGLLAYRGFDEVSRQFASLKEDATRTAQEIEASEQFGEVATEFGLSEKVRTFFDDLPLELTGGSAAEAVQSAASSGGALFAIWMLSLLMLVFGRRILRSAVDQFDDPVVAWRAHHLIGLAFRDSSRYVWLMICRAVVVGVLAGIGSAAIGVETPTAFAVWFALLSLVPGFGIVVAAIPLSVSQAVGSAPLGLAVLAVALVVQVADVVVVQRRIERVSVHVGPGLTVVAALIGLQLYGPGGLLVVLALTIYGIAVVRRLTEDHDNVVSAVRAFTAPVPVDG